MDEPRQQTGRGEARRFSDGAGHKWSAWVEMREQVDGSSTPVLIFMSDHAIRCVTRFPPDWRSESDAELERMSWRV